MMPLTVFLISWIKPMNKANMMGRGLLAAALVALVSACSTPRGSAVDVPVEERDHGVVTAYRINPADRDRPASSSSARWG